MYVFLNVYMWAYAVRLKCQIQSMIVKQVIHNNLYSIVVQIMDKSQKFRSSKDILIDWSGIYSMPRDILYTNFYTAPLSRSFKEITESNKSKTIWMRTLIQIGNGLLADSAALIRVYCAHAQNQNRTVTTLTTY